MTKSAHLHIAADVAGMLRHRPHDTTRLLQEAVAGYRCPACEQPGRIPAHSTAVIIILSMDTEFDARLAHTRCKPSGVYVVPTTEPATDWPVAGWLRPRHCQPRAVLLIAPRHIAIRELPNGDTADELSSRLLEHGFDLLMHPNQPMSPVPALTAAISANGRLHLTDPDGDTFWSGTPPLPDGWTRAATATRTIGVVYAPGLFLHPDLDYRTDLDIAINDGDAVAGTASLTEPDTPHTAAQSRTT